MQTRFTAEQLAEPETRDSERNIRACVHCGFCLSTCPTYTLLGDERDSPRGRIYLIKDMLEHDRPASREVVTHIDRCLSCLSCMTTCPSGVNYQHLIDHARSHVEATYKRPFLDRSLRQVLAKLPRPGVDQDRVIFPAIGPRRARVALLAGCAQRVLAPSINEATIRLLTRHGVEVVVPRQSGCCGAIVHHLGKAEQARALAVQTMTAWQREIDGGDGLDAIIVNTSGCGTEIKDYGHIFRDDPVWAKPAGTISALARDISEFAAGLELRWGSPHTDRPVVAYHAACSLQHGQKVTRQPKELIEKAGFTVRDVPEGHLCCGSAGTYNLLQPEIAGRLRDRKLENIARTAPAIIATGNIGCITQLASGTDIPVVHTVELLDWATGGPMPEALKRQT
jgi:glycolate oxidase iron-sulfur subunit